MNIDNPYWRLALRSTHLHIHTLSLYIYTYNIYIHTYTCTHTVCTQYSNCARLHTFVQTSATTCCVLSHCNHIHIPIIYYIYMHIQTHTYIYLYVHIDRYTYLYMDKYTHINR